MTTLTTLPANLHAKFDGQQALSTEQRVEITFDGVTTRGTVKARPYPYTHSVVELDGTHQRVTVPLALLTGL